MVSSTTCNVCGSETEEVFRKLILEKHDVGYHRCRACGFIQTDPPHWLAEAYEDAISAVDTGLVARAIGLAPRIESLIRRLSDVKGRFLDYGGGSGLFVRHMRDRGFRFYRSDPHARPIFSRYFDLEDLNANERRFELATAFEVLEHLRNPLEDMEQMLTRTQTLVFTTELVPTNNAIELASWWYFGEVHGQHISFFTPDSLSIASDRLGAKYIQIASDLHVVTRDADAGQRLGRPEDATVLEPLTWNDSLLAGDRRKAERSGFGRSQS